MATKCDGLASLKLLKYPDEPIVCEVHAVRVDSADGLSTGRLESDRSTAVQMQGFQGRIIGQLFKIF